MGKEKSGNTRAHGHAQKLNICMLGDDVILGTKILEDNSMEPSNESLKVGWC